MGLGRVAAIVGAMMLTSACVEPPVKPIPEISRQSVTAISADVSGIKDSDTSDIGARGSSEGSQRGAAQGAAALTASGSLVGFILAPIGAAVGSAKGAADAQSEDVVDQTRTNLRIAMQETDFGDLLRSRLAAAGVAGQVQIVAATSGAATAPLQSTAGKPVGQVLALEYKVSIARLRHVNPEIGIVVQVTAQVSSPDRKTLVHKATWTYCSPRQNFVKMAANEAVALRSEIITAATILAEAIPYDLYVSKEPRPLKTSQCMDFSNLPSGRGRPPPSPLMS
jgi:hypothetical protein